MSKDQCPQCAGTGEYMSESQARYPIEGEDITCDMCKGIGTTGTKTTPIKQEMKMNDNIVSKHVYLIVGQDRKDYSNLEIYEGVMSSYNEAVNELGETSSINPIIIGLTINVPKNAFAPKLNLEINIPEDAFERKPIPAELNEVVIPIELNEQKSSVKVSETLEDGNGMGIIAYLKSMFSPNKDK